MAGSPVRAAACTRARASGSSRRTAGGGSAVAGEVEMSASDSANAPPTNACFTADRPAWRGLADKSWANRWGRAAEASKTGSPVGGPVGTRQAGQRFEIEVVAPQV